MGASQSKTVKTGSSRYRITDNKTKRGLYFAYGSNLNLAQMLGHRCPNAKPLFKARLDNWALKFRGCADIAPCPGGFVSGGVFEITPECEIALDRYEGYPSLYTKGTARIKLDSGAVETMMFYTMTRQNYESGPSRDYLNTILKGYADFQMDDAEFQTLLGAVNHAEEQEQQWARNSGLVRNGRGRYVTPTTTIKPFITARNLERDTVRPYDQIDLDRYIASMNDDFIDGMDDSVYLSDLLDREFDDDDRDFDDETLSDLIGTLNDHE